MDECLVKNDLTEKTTAKAFLVLLKNLRWVLLQNAILLIERYGREHYVFSNNPQIFKSGLFLDYSDKLMGYLRDSVDPIDVDVEKILPGVIGKFDTQENKIDKLSQDMHHLADERSVKNISDDIEVRFSRSIRDSIKSFSSHIGKAFSSFSSDDDPREDKRNSGASHSICYFNELNRKNRYSTRLFN